MEQAGHCHATLNVSASVVSLVFCGDKVQKKWLQKDTHKNSCEIIM